MAKSDDDFTDTINLLRVYILAHREGSKEVYRPAAVELRKLLCDKKALLPRAMPGIRLHKLASTVTRETMPLMAEAEFYMGDTIHTDHQGLKKLILGFASGSEADTLMTIEDWVRQPLFNSNITIWSFIKSVADKEGAHSDPSYGETIEYTKQFMFANSEIRAPYIMAFAEYVRSCVMNFHESGSPLWGDKRKLS